MGLFVIHMPGDPEKPFNAVIRPALEVVFGSTGRIVVASMIAYWCGGFVNSYVMAKMKVWTEGRHLWTRTIGSTAVGQLVNSTLFIRLPSSEPGSPGR
ncbi:MAG: VUT family protein [Nitrospira sp.]|nr:VUT family protein [Nitrospira sp.]